MVCKVTPNSNQDNGRNGVACAVAAVTDFDSALDLTGYGRFSWSTLAACTGSFFAAGVQNALSAYTLPAAACELGLTTYRAGLVNVGFMCGGVASAFLWGIVADIFGLKRTLILTLLLDATLTLAQSGVRQFEVLIAVRACNGFLIGGPSTLVMNYLSDLIGKKKRQLYLNVTGLSFMLAWVILPAIAWLIIPFKTDHPFLLDSWRLYVAICSIPGFAAGVWMLFLPESPRVLLNSGRTEEALDILGGIFRANTGRPVEEFAVKKLIPDSFASSEDDLKRHRSLLMDVFRQLGCLVSKKYAFKSTLIAFIFFANMAAGFGLSMWIPELLVRMKQTTSSTECGVRHAVPTTRLNLTLSEILGEQSIVEGLGAGNITEITKRIVINKCRDNLDAEVYISGLIVGACCVLGNAACSLLCTLGSRGVRRACVACALVCAGACVGVFACVCACVSSSTAAVAVVAALNAAALNGNVLLIRLLLYALPPRLSALGVCWGAWWGRAGGVASNLAIGALLDVSCAAPFLSVAVLLALSAVGITLVRDAICDEEHEVTTEKEAERTYTTTHM